MAGGSPGATAGGGFKSFNPFKRVEAEAGLFLGVP
jgi:hypothetical protein